MLMLFCFFACAIAYNQFILFPIFDEYTTEDTYSHIANIHDHWEYFNRFVELDDREHTWDNYFDNVTGVAILFGFFCKIFTSCDFHYLALYINLLFLFLTALVNLKLTNTYFNKTSVKYLFFLNFSYIYLAQLAGKDIIYSFFLYMILFNYLQRKWIAITILVFICALLVRFQIVILYALLILMNMRFLSVKIRFLTAYTMASLLGAIAFSGVIGTDADLGSGLSSYVRQINESYYIGNFLLNPLRLVQYVYELITIPIMSIYPELLFSGFFILAFTIYLLAHLRSIPKLINIETNDFSMFFLCLVLMLLIVPIINLRYFVIIIPFMILAMNYTNPLQQEFR